MTAMNSINAPFPLTLAQGGTGSENLSHGIVVSVSGSPALVTIPSTDEYQILMTDDEGTYITTDFAAGSGIQISYSKTSEPPIVGTITITNTGTEPSTVSVNSPTQQLENNTFYITSYADQVTYFLPGAGVANLGDTYTVCDPKPSLGGWVISLSTANQTIVADFGTVTSGNVLHTDTIRCVVTLKCVNTNIPGSEVFQIISSQGTIDIVAE